MLTKFEKFLYKDTVEEADQLNQPRSLLVSNGGK